MSLIELTIRRLRAKTAAFMNEDGDPRVAGLAELSALREKQNLPTPAAFVLPGGESVSSVDGQGTVFDVFSITYAFTVVVWLKADYDTRGQEPTHRLEAIRDELLEALVPWHPRPGSTGFRYLGMEPGGLDADRSVYLFNFSVMEEINMGCIPEFGDQHPAQVLADRFGGTATIPDICEDGQLGHSKPIGVYLADKPCDGADNASQINCPDDKPEAYFGAELKERADATDDECPSS